MVERSAGLIHCTAFLIGTFGRYGGKKRHNEANFNVFLQL